MDKAYPSNMQQSHDLEETSQLTNILIGSSIGSSNVKQQITRRNSATSTLEECKLKTLLAEKDREIA